MTNEIAKTNNQVSTKVSFTNFMTSNLMKAKVNEILGDEKKAARFTSSIVSAVNNNPQLRECDNMSILSGALLGDSLNLSPSPQLGRFYLLPFKDKDRGMVAQFILGYKGYLELALRSGQYKNINVIEIREGEYLGRNKETGNPTFEFIEDDDLRETKDIIGYMASFTLENGFTKTLYWSKKKMEEHALQYSSGYRADKKNKTQYTFWSKDFTGQAFKTMLRQLISKWGLMSIDMQQAFEKDMGTINEDGSVTYVDNVNDLDFTPTVSYVEKGEESQEPKTMKLDDVE